MFDLLHLQSFKGSATKTGLCSAKSFATDLDILAGILGADHSGLDEARMSDVIASICAHRGQTDRQCHVLERQPDKWEDAPMCLKVE